VTEHIFPENSEKNSSLLVLISTVQGLALLAMYRSYDDEWWSHDLGFIAYGLWAFLVTFPLLLMLMLEPANEVKVAGYAAAFTGLITLLALYLGYQLSPLTEIRGETASFVFVLAMIVATFKALMYLQQRSLQLPFSYSVLFTLSWRNFLITLLAGLFVGVVGLLLLLWQGLFSAIGIELFAFLFKQDWFLFPVLGFSLGLGVVIFRDLSHILDSITRLLQGLLRLVLPILVVLSVSFLTSLAFVGLDVLWAIGSGTSLLLWLLAITLFFTNAVYQDGRGDTVYSPGVHRLVMLGMLALPVLSVLAFYGLLMRIEQYGFTVARLYALLVWFLFSLFAFGYAGAVLRFRDQWTHGFTTVNIYLGLAVLVSVLLVNSPIIDFRKISVSSQVARLESGAISVNEFDALYFRRVLGRPGSQALIELGNRYDSTHPDVVSRWRSSNQIQPAPAKRELQMFPDSLVIPDEIKTQISQQHLYSNANLPLMVTAIDLNRDGDQEYIVFSAFQSGSPVQGIFYQSINGHWMTGNITIPQAIDFTELQKQLEKAQLTTIEKEFLDLSLGGVRLTVQPNYRMNRMHNLNIQTAPAQQIILEDVNRPAPGAAGTAKTQQ